MSEVPTGGELARPFLPTRDFDVSKRFYEALGFEKLLDGDVAIFKVGASSFILQRRYQDEWAENFMMQLMVDDVDAWWAHITRLDLPRQFGVQPPQPPAIQPWGTSRSVPDGSEWHPVAHRAATRRGRPRLNREGVTCRRARG